VFKYVFLIFQILLLCSCDGVIANHYASRLNGPIDGSKSSNKERFEIVYYPNGNLEHLNDRKTRNNNVYFASAKRYNDLQYDVAKDYLENYAKFLKIDAKELEQMVKNEQLGVKGEEISRKMEVGELPVHPFKGNVLVIQKLKDEDDKIAFPDYMSEFLDIYQGVEGKNDKPVEVQEKNTSSNSVYAMNAVDFRDAYVDYYLSLSNEYAENNPVVFKEKKLI